MELHRHLLQTTGVWRGENAAPAPHNWLATREWLLVVPRSRERAGGIGVNALGFAGSLLVRSDEQLAWLRTQGPLDFLRLVVEEIAWPGFHCRSSSSWYTRSDQRYA